MGDDFTIYNGKRVAKGWPEKVERAHRVIDNSGSPAELYAQLDAIWNELAAGT